MQKKLDNSQKLSVLVIEDNLGDFVLIEDYLLEKFASIEVQHFSDYKSAVSYLETAQTKPSLLLLDLNLPDMEGVDLVQAMLKLDHQIPIIVLTGYSDLTMAENSLQLGVSDYLVKDEINPTLLHKSVVFALSRSSYVKQIENQIKSLKKIAWTQSHVVRAPVARILGIIHMLESLQIEDQELRYWLEQLKISSDEMDNVIRSIVNESQEEK